MNNLNIKIKHKKLLAILLSVLFVVICAAVLFFVFTCKQKSTPTNLSVYFDDETLCATCDKVDCDYYIFSINGTEVKTKNNFADLSGVALIEGEYSINVKTIGLFSLSLSESSETVVITKYAKLDAPIIEKSGEQLIVWQAIENATKYKVYYTASNYIETTNCYFDSSLLGAGEYSIRVCAIIDKKYWVDSLPSNAIYLNITKQLDEPICEYDSANKLLTINKVENAINYKISINGNDSFVLDAFAEDSLQIDLMALVSDAVISEILVKSLGEGGYIDSLYINVPIE